MIVVRQYVQVDFDPDLNDSEQIFAALRALPGVLEVYDEHSTQFVTEDPSPPHECDDWHDGQCSRCAREVQS